MSPAASVLVAVESTVLVVAAAAVVGESKVPAAACSGSSFGVIPMTVVVAVVHQRS